MSTTKELLTRIALKYDNYIAWTTAPGKDLILLKGELGLCEIPNGNTAATTSPTVLFKVGDGINTFETLKWASATASDVYTWAKAETVVLEGEVLKFKTGTEVRHSIDLSTFATDAASKLITDALDSRITSIEADLGISGDVQNQLNTLDGRLDIIEGSAAGSITKAAADTLASANAYTDTAETDAVATAASYTDIETAKDRTRLDTLESSTSALTSATSAIDDRLIEVENFFDLESGESLDAALDRLVEIQTYLETEGTAADQMLSAVNANTTAITGIQNIVNDGGTLDLRVDATESTLTALDARVDTAESEIDAIQVTVNTGANANATLRTDITSLQTLTGDANKGNEKLRSDLTTLQNIVNNELTGLAATKTIADAAKAQAEANASAISDISADYLKAADGYILTCGTATTVIYTA